MLAKSDEQGIGAIPVFILLQSIDHW